MFQVGKRTFLGRIQTLVDSANRQKSQTQLLADKLASRFIPFILVLTLLTLTVWVLLVMFDVVVPQPPVPTIRTMSSTAGLVRTLFILFSKATFITQFPIAVLAVACPCALGKSPFLSSEDAIGFVLVLLFLRHKQLYLFSHDVVFQDSLHPLLLHSQPFVPRDLVCSLKV